MKMVSCMACGTKFERTHNAQKYCDECKPRNYYKPRKKAKPRPAISLVDINRLARESGMTYGQYVASEFLQRGRTDG